MNELKDTKLVKEMDKSMLGNDVGAINMLCNFLNNPLVTGADAREAEAQTQSLAAAQVPEQPRSAVIASPKNISPTPVPTFRFDRFFMTGRLCSGKDYVAAQTGAKIEGFARPLYSLATFFFGVNVDEGTNKDLPGMRAFLQAAGQWGRALVNEKYPFTPARAVFISAIRSLGAAGLLDRSLGVNWDQYGKNDNIWLDAALVRVAAQGAPRTAITNVRFSNEFTRLTSEKWVNWHCMTDPKTWTERLAKRGIKADAPVLKDDSEALAAHLDAQVTKEISKSKTGAKLRCVWNSPLPAPSPRLFTVAEFLRAANVAPAAVSQEDVILTGE